MNTGAETPRKKTAGYPKIFEAKAAQEESTMVKKKAQEEIKFVNGFAGASIPP
jgi:hypothetical protein